MVAPVIATEFFPCGVGMTRLARGPLLELMFGLGVWDSQRSRSAADTTSLLPAPDTLAVDTSFLLFRGLSNRSFARCACQATLVLIASSEHAQNFAGAIGPTLTPSRLEILRDCR